MRLIDADTMLKRNSNSIYDTSDLKEMLNYEPTAYDVSKAIDKLEKWKSQSLDGLISVQVAIDFVKGGLEE